MIRAVALALLAALSLSACRAQPESVANRFDRTSAEIENMARQLDAETENQVRAVEADMQNQIDAIAANQANSVEGNLSSSATPATASTAPGRRNR